MGGNECQGNQSKEESIYVLDLCEYVNVTVFTRVQNYYVISHNRKYLEHLFWLIGNWTQ